MGVYYWPMSWLPQCSNDSRTGFLQGKKGGQVIKENKGIPDYRVSRLMPLKSCMTSPMVFAPNAVWTELISSWIAASHI